jgi:3-hydroxymyristoyl/3-hydroxydecanoyl-(acyl carrier protein) dehydratase
MIEFRYAGVIPPDHPCLPGHFPGRPIVPAVVLLEHVELALRRALGDTARLRGLPNVKFLHPLAPGVAFDVVLHIEAGSARFRCVAAGSELAAGKLEYVNEP